MLVSVDEFRDYIQDPTFDQDRATSILMGTQKSLENRINRPVEPMLVREAVIPGSDGYAFVSITPVWRILEINFGTSDDIITQEVLGPPASDAGATGGTIDWATQGMRALPNRVYVGGSYGLFESPVFYGQPEFPRVIVTYVAGYNGYVDDALKIAIKRVAAREVAHNYDDTISLRDVVYNKAEDADTRPKGWTPEEYAEFDRLRRRVIA